MPDRHCGAGPPEDRARDGGGRAGRMTAGDLSGWVQSPDASDPPSRCGPAPAVGRRRPAGPRPDPTPTVARLRGERLGGGPRGSPTRRAPATAPITRRRATPGRPSRLGGQGGHARLSAGVPGRRLRRVRGDQFPIDAVWGVRDHRGLRDAAVRGAARAPGATGDPRGGGVAAPAPPSPPPRGDSNLRGHRSAALGGAALGSDAVPRNSPSSLTAGPGFTMSSSRRVSPLLSARSSRACPTQLDGTSTDGAPRSMG